MMAARPVATPDAVYTVVEGDRLVADALVVARLVDSATRRPITGGGLAAGARVRTDRPHAAAHLASGGYLVVTGRPGLVLPRLTTANETLPVVLEIGGRPRQLLDLVVPINSVLPLVLPDIEIEGPPVTVVGTVTAVAFPFAPVAGAVVHVALPAPATPPFPLGVRTTVSHPHPAGALVRARSLAGAAPATTVSALSVGGQSQVVLGSVAGCAPGGVLALGGDVDVEHLVIDQIDVPSRTVTARAPLRRTRPVGATARPFSLGAAGAGSVLARDARRGDGLLLTGTDLAGNEIVEVSAPNPAFVEFRAVGARTDGDGRFRVEGVRGVELLALTPENPPSAPGDTVVFVLDPVSDTVRCDLAL